MVDDTEKSKARPPSKVAGLLYGLGFGGFVDGIVLHQIFQWHHMVSDVHEYPMTTLAGLEVNTLADGLFHVRDDLGAPLSWDIGLLVLGVALVVGGWLLHKRGVREVEAAAGRDENRV